ncbi:MAG: alpha-galactosidase [Lachnospiraceae bacterium]|nr:alpha-galactosidase [Lachnospiraceae bacterium]
MGIFFDDANRLFFIETPGTSMCLALADEEGFLCNAYYGAAVGRDDLRYLLGGKNNPAVPSRNDRDRGCYFDKTRLEFPSGGTGDYRNPVICVRDAGGHDSSLFTYVSHRIYEGKEEISAEMTDGRKVRMPAAFPGKAGAQTLRIVLEEKVLGLRAYLSYSVFDDSDAILKSVRLTNESDTTVILDKLLSSNLDLDLSCFENHEPDIVTLSGSWARERRMDRRRISRGNSEVYSTRGESSHQFQPFMALCENGADDSKGRIYAQTLIWSGNFVCGAGMDQFETVRSYIGISPEHFTWDLKPGESFQSPEAVLVFTEKGFDGMSHIFHDLFRGHLIRSPYLYSERPILINNWEATYFDFNTDKLLDIARDAKKCGIEMLVMDDGWFGKRDDDNSSLGDWVVNEKKLPGGIERLSGELEKMGMKFGIWFEPEMVSPDSDLYRAHPDWAISSPGRVPTRIRNQYVLDITRSEVRDHVYECVAKILRSAKISYVKWDMNRQLSDLGSTGLDASSMGRLSYLYTLGVYDLQERLLEEFPDLLLENCSGGGARYDAGMLFYSPQIWCSDDTDAYERLTIQAGTEMIYPLSTMGAHVSASPNHISGRVMPFDVRGAVALSGTFGYELDITAIPDAERESIPEQVAIYHSVGDIVREGDYYRIARVSDIELYDAWMSVTKDKKRALLTYVQCKGSPRTGKRVIRLKGLDPDMMYSLKLIGSDDENSRFCSHGKKHDWKILAPEGAVSGKSLMNAGLMLPVLWGEYGQMMFEIRQV